MRRILYVSHAVLPTDEEIESAIKANTSMARDTCKPRTMSDIQIRYALAESNVAKAKLWLNWLRRSFLETTFIAPWIVRDDSDPTQHDSGLIDDCATIERCDGIVLCGPRISGEMRRRMEHGVRVRGWYMDGTRSFDVYDLTFLPARNINGATPQGSPTFTAWVETMKMRAGR